MRLFPGRQSHTVMCAAIRDPSFWVVLLDINLSEGRTCLCNTAVSKGAQQWIEPTQLLAAVGQPLSIHIHRVSHHSSACQFIL